MEYKALLHVKPDILSLNRPQDLWHNILDGLTSKGYLGTNKSAEIGRNSNLPHAVFDFMVNLLKKKNCQDQQKIIKDFIKFLGKSGQRIKKEMDSYIKGML